MLKITIMHRTLLLFVSLMLATSHALGVEDFVFEENFDAFTEGSVGSPAETDIAESGKLAETLTGWSGQYVYEAGGSLLLGKDDLFDPGLGILTTSDLSLSADEAPIRITIRVKSAEKYGNLIYIYSGATKVATFSFDDGDWHEYTIVVGSSFENGLTIEGNNSTQTPFYIDYLKVEQNDHIVPTPTALPVNDFDGKTFTARWLSVSGATDYLVSLYSKNEDGTRNYALEDASAGSGDVTSVQITIPEEVAGETFYYNVKAKKGDDVSMESEEFKIIKYISELPAPEALEATDVTTDGFTANWTAVEDASKYTVSVYKKVTLTENLDVDVITEDFSGITDGSLSWPSDPGVADELLDDYTTVPGWMAGFHMYADGNVCLFGLGSKAYLQTPQLDLSKNSGVFAMQMSLAAMSFWDGEYITDETVTVKLCHKDNGVESVLEQYEVTIDEAMFSDYIVDFTKGCADAYLRIEYTGTEYLFIDAVTVKQESKAGDVISSKVMEEYSEDVSHYVSIDMSDGATYSYTVTAEAITVGYFTGYEETIYSVPSNEMVVKTPSCINGLGSNKPFITTSNGRITVYSDRDTSIMLYDITGKLLRSMSVSKGYTTLDATGLVIIRVGNTSFKTLVE